MGCYTSRAGRNGGQTSNKVALLLTDHIRALFLHLLYQVVNLNLSAESANLVRQGTTSQLVSQNGIESECQPKT